MATHSTEFGELSAVNTGNVLCVTDMAGPTEESLELALQAADKCGGDLELVCVIDLGREPSMPDGQMGIRFVLDSLARKVRTAHRIVTATLLFGRPEEAIAERAATTNAALIALASGASDPATERRKQIKRIRSCVSCPVVDICSAKARQSHRVRKLNLASAS